MRVHKEQPSNGKTAGANQEDSGNLKLPGTLYVNTVEAVSELDRETGSDTCCYVEPQRATTHFLSPPKYVKA